MARYTVLRGSVKLNDTRYTVQDVIELDEEHAGRFPSGFLQLLDTPVNGSPDAPAPSVEPPVKPSRPTRKK